MPFGKRVIQPDICRDLFQPFIFWPAFVHRFHNAMTEGHDIPVHYSGEIILLKKRCAGEKQIGIAGAWRHKHIADNNKFDFAFIFQYRVAPVYIAVLIDQAVAAEIQDHLNILIQTGVYAFRIPLLILAHPHIAAKIAQSVLDCQVGAVICRFAPQKTGYGEGEGVWRNRKRRLRVPVPYGDTGSRSSGDTDAAEKRAQRNCAPDGLLPVGVPLGAPALDNIAGLCLPHASGQFPYPFCRQTGNGCAPFRRFGDSVFLSG